MLLFGKSRLPVGGQQFGFLGNGVNVVRQRQRYDVRLQAVDYGAGLRAGPAVRLLNRDVLAGLGLPIFREGPVVVLIQLARGIVRDVQQRWSLGPHGRMGPRINPMTMRKTHTILFADFICSLLLLDSSRDLDSDVWSGIARSTSDPDPGLILRYGRM